MHCPHYRPRVNLEYDLWFIEEASGHFPFVYDEFPNKHNHSHTFQLAPHDYRYTYAETSESRTRLFC